MKTISFKIKTLTIILMGLLFYFCSAQKPYIEAFTHPFNLDEVLVYSKPGIFHSYLKPDEEAGWIIKIYNQDSGYLNVRLPDECDILIKDVWIKI